VSELVILLKAILLIETGNASEDNLMYNLYKIPLDSTWK
jgi:hypothetical protein